MTRLSAFLPCLALVACVAEDQTTILILHNVVPTEMCEIPAEEGSAFSSSGVLDIESGLQDYTFTPLLRSSAVGDPNDVNRRVVQIQGAETDLYGGASQQSVDLVNGLGDALRFRETRVSGSLSPNGSVTSLHYTMIDLEQANALAAGVAGDARVQIVASTRVYGDMDGSRVESKFFDYPITVCRGCVLVPGCFGDQTP